MRGLVGHQGRLESPIRQISAARKLPDGREAGVPERVFLVVREAGECAQSDDRILVWRGSVRAGMA